MIIAKKSKKFLEPMTLSQVKEAVKAHSKGFCDVEYLAGAPISLEHGTLYVTTRMSYRFNLKYFNNKIIKLEASIYKSVTKEEIDQCKKTYDSLSSEQQNCVSKTALDTLKDKEAKLASGLPIYLKDRPTKAKKHDPDDPHIIQYDNGTCSLICYKSFQYNVHKGEYRHPETHYYFAIRDSEYISEISSTDPKLTEALERAKETARKAAGKCKTSKPSLVITPAIGHILTIAGDK